MARVGGSDNSSLDLNHDDTQQMVLKLTAQEEEIKCLREALPMRDSHQQSPVVQAGDNAISGPVAGGLVHIQ